MWPFEGKKIADRLAGASRSEAGGATEVSVVTTITSPNLAVSPFTGIRAALIYLEVLERVTNVNEGASASTLLYGADGGDRDAYHLIGSIVIGDLVTLRDADGDELTVVARRSRIVPALPRTTGTPIEEAPAEIVPLMTRGSGRGSLCYHELLLSEGDKLKVTAWIEPSSTVVSAGYRSGSRVTYVARDDRDELVLLEEIFEAPAF